MPDKGPKDNSIVSPKETVDATIPELFLEFFKLGCFTIGGGITMIPLLQGIVSDRKKWLTEEEVVDCIAVSQSLPGIIAINMATYVGYHKKGILGSAAATFGVILPSLISIIAVIEILKGIGDNKYIDGALTGIRAAATGLIAYSAYSVGRKVLKDQLCWIIAAAAFILITFLDVSIVYIVLGAAVLGLAASMLADRKKTGNTVPEEKSGASESNDRSDDAGGEEGDQE